jgi:addiction module RelE/StbE family toxin
MAAFGRGISALSKFFARYTPEYSRLISKLPPEIKRLVRSTVDALLTKHEMDTELTGELDGYRSYRVRRYRIIYRVNEEDSCLEVYHVGYRRDVYESLRSLLSRRSQ